MAAWVSVFLLSLFLFLPFSRRLGLLRKRWIALRAVLCVGVTLISLAVGGTPLAAVYETTGISGMADLPLYALFYFVMLVGLLLVYLILFIDKRMVGQRPGSCSASSEGSDVASDE